MSNNKKLTYKEFIEEYLPTEDGLIKLSDKVKNITSEVIDEVKQVSKRVFGECDDMSPEELVHYLYNSLGNHSLVGDIVTTVDEETGSIQLNITIRKL